mmetsp:Transcript_4201/g.3989  ORF Transcript_4201/g.3989 Transcript_4201/m.3989 type:complete len:83 (-) Transcript_4201:95-343(-)
MRTLYKDTVDHIPPNIPRPLWSSVQLNAFVDANHTEELLTRRSQPLRMFGESIDRPCGVSCYTNTVCISSMISITTLKMRIP